MANDSEMDDLRKLLLRCGFDAFFRMCVPRAFICRTTSRQFEISISVMLIATRILSTVGAQTAQFLVLWTYAERAVVSGACVGKVTGLT
jgi:hypothetical protein